MTETGDKRFEVTSEMTGEQYTAEFRWLQTAISLRHSDTVDVKWLVNGAGKIVAIPHGTLEQACYKLGARLTDELCVRIAAEHLREELRAGAEEDILTMTPSRVEQLVAATALRPPSRNPPSRDREGAV